jgi:hypothetical protein
VRSALAALIALGCGPSPSSSVDHHVHDVMDRCQLLQPGCPGPEDDGCPELVIELAQGCTSERTRATLGELSDLLKGDPRFTRVLVKGDPYLASCVAGEVRAMGVDEARVEAQNDKTPYVSFEVAAWNGGACR